MCKCVRWWLHTECDGRIPQSASKAVFEFENSSLSCFNPTYVPSDLIAQHDPGPALQPGLVEDVPVCLAEASTLVWNKP